MGTAGSEHRPCFSRSARQPENRVAGAVAAGLAMMLGAIFCVFDLIGIPHPRAEHRGCAECSSGRLVDCGGHQLVPA